MIFFAWGTRLRACAHSVFAALHMHGQSADRLLETDTAAVQTRTCCKSAQSACFKAFQ